MKKTEVNSEFDTFAAPGGEDVLSVLWLPRQGAALRYRLALAWCPAQCFGTAQPKRSLDGPPLSRMKLSSVRARCVQPEGAASECCSTQTGSVRSEAREQSAPRSQRFQFAGILVTLGEL